MHNNAVYIKEVSKGFYISLEMSSFDLILLPIVSIHCFNCFNQTKMKIAVGVIKIIMYHLFLWHFSSLESKGSILTCCALCMLKEVTFKFTVLVNL